MFRGTLPRKSIWEKHSTLTQRRRVWPSCNDIFLIQWNIKYDRQGRSSLRSGHRCAVPFLFIFRWSFCFTYIKETSENNIEIKRRMSKKWGNCERLGPRRILMTTIRRRFFSTFSIELNSMNCHGLIVTWLAVTYSGGC